MLATFSTLWPPSWHADVTASVYMFRYATPSVRRELRSMEVTYFALAGWNRCFHTRLGIQVVLHPLRVPSAPFTRVCRGDFARYVIGSGIAGDTVTVTSEKRMRLRKVEHSFELNIKFEKATRICCLRIMTWQLIPICENFINVPCAFLTIAFLLLLNLTAMYIQMNTGTNVMNRDNSTANSFV